MTEQKLESLRSSCISASSKARVWFECASTKDQFNIRGGISDTGKGAVYVYYGKGEDTYYVGATTRRIKARMYDATSAHKNKEWWEKWTSCDL